MQSILIGSFILIEIYKCEEWMNEQKFRLDLYEQKKTLRNRRRIKYTINIQWIQMWSHVIKRISFLEKKIMLVVAVVQLLHLLQEFRFISFKKNFSMRKEKTEHNMNLDPEK